MQEWSMYIYTVSEHVLYQLLLAILPVFRLHTCKSLQACSHCQGSVSAVVAFACDSWSSPWIFALNASAPYSPGFREGWTASKKTSGWCLILLPQTSTSCFESNKANKQFGRRLIEFRKCSQDSKKHWLACRILILPEKVAKASWNTCRIHPSIHPRIINIWDKSDSLGLHEKYEKEISLAAWIAMSQGPWANLSKGVANLCIQHRLIQVWQLIPR